AWAYGNGLRDIGLLFNYANTEILNQRALFAIPLFTEILDIDPLNKTAIRDRGMAHVSAVMNSPKLPNPQAFDDARRYCELEPDSFEAPYCAAVIFAHAARKDAAYQSVAIDFLTQALRKGMPLHLVQNFSYDLKPLL